MEDGSRLRRAHDDADLKSSSALRIACERQMSSEDRPTSFSIAVMPRPRRPRRSLCRHEGGRGRIRASARLGRLFRTLDQQIVEPMLLDSAISASLPVAARMLWWKSRSAWLPAAEASVSCFIVARAAASPSRSASLRRSAARAAALGSTMRLSSKSWVMKKRARFDLGIPGERVVDDMFSVAAREDAHARLGRLSTSPLAARMRIASR